MKIYDYSSIGNVFLGSNVSSHNGSFFTAIVNYLQTGAEIDVHPKEIERQQRIFKRKKYLHGATAQTKIHIGGNSLYNNSVIIINGNTGFGTKSMESFTNELEKLNAVLEKNNCHILFVRGNMDDPSFFTEHKIDFSNIKLIEDYSLIKLNNFNCLCVGGSISIDREWKKSQSDRLGKPMYWENEGTEFNEGVLDEILAENDIACIITNDSPSFVSEETSSYKNSKWATSDKEITKDMINQRIVMDKIYSKFVMTDKKPYVWVHTSTSRTEQMLNSIEFEGVCSVGGEMLNLNQIVHSSFGIPIGGYTGNGKKVRLKKATNPSYTATTFTAPINFNPAPVWYDGPGLGNTTEDEAIGGMALGEPERQNPVAGGIAEDIDRRIINDIARRRVELGIDQVAEATELAHPRDNEDVAIVAAPEEPAGFRVVRNNTNIQDGMNRLQEALRQYHPDDYTDDWQ